MRLWNPSWLLFSLIFYTSAFAFLISNYTILITDVFFRQTTQVSPSPTVSRSETLSRDKVLGKKTSSGPTSLSNQAKNDHGYVAQVWNQTKLWISSRPWLVLGFTPFDRKKAQSTEKKSWETSFNRKTNSPNPPHNPNRLLRNDLHGFKPDSLILWLLKLA